MFGLFDFKDNNKRKPTRGGGLTASFSAKSSSHGSRNVEVVSISVLKGLPSSLTAAILVHEAIHAWFALNPVRSKGDGVSIRKIPPQIEEGCCQLVSHLYLRHLISKHSESTTIKQGADKELNECFRWQIETDTSEVYGDGFRKAAMAYERVCESGGGLLTMLEYVCTHLDLPRGE